MAERSARPNVIPNAVLCGLCVYGWHALMGTGLEPAAYVCVALAGLAGLAGLKALSALSARGHEIYTLAKASRPEVSHDGTARFQSSSETKKNGHYKPRGSLIGIQDAKLIFDDQSVHSVTFAPPGTGKTTGPVICNAALAAVSGEFDVVIYADPKPEIGPILKAFVERHGGRHLTIKPTRKFEDIFGQSAEFNPCDLLLRSAQSAPENLLGDCRSLNLQLIKQKKNGEEKAKWWKEGANDDVTVIQAYLALTDPEQCSFPNILSILEDPVRFDKLLDEISEQEDLLNGDLARMAKSIIALRMQDPKNAGSMLSEAITSLKMYRSSGAVAQISRKTSFDLSQATKRKPLVIGLSCDMTMIDDQLQLIGLNMLAIIRMAVRLPRPLKIKVIYDEAAFAPLENLVDLLVIGRGLGVSFELFYQSSADARRVLGKEGFESLMANCDRKVWFGLNDPKEAEELSKALGEYGALKESYRGDSDMFNINRSHEKRRLATGDQLRRLPRGLQVALIRNEKPMICETVSYGQIKPFSKQMGKSPWHERKLKLKTRVWLTL